MELGHVDALPKPWNALIHPTQTLSEESACLIAPRNGAVKKEAHQVNLRFQGLMRSSFTERGPTKKIPPYGSFGLKFEKDKRTKRQEDKSRRYYYVEILKVSLICILWIL